MANTKEKMKKICSFFCLIFLVSCYGNPIATSLKHGNEKLRKGDYKGAIADYNYVISLDSINEAAYYKRGTCKENIKDYKGAALDYNKALEINPSADTIHLLRAILLFEHPAEMDTIDGSYSKDSKTIEKFNFILSDLNSALKTDSNFQSALEERGIINYNLAQSFVYRDNFKNQFLSKKYYNDALNDFNRLKKLDNKTSIAYDMSGDIKKELNDYPGAIAEYSHVIAMYPNSEESFFSRARCKSALNDYQGAIKDYDSAIKFNSRDAGLYYFERGTCKYKIGEKDNACLDWSKAGEKGILSAYDMIKQYCN